MSVLNCQLYRSGKIEDMGCLVIRHSVKYYNSTWRDTILICLESRLSSSMVQKICWILLKSYRLDGRLDIKINWINVKFCCYKYCLSINQLLDHWIIGPFWGWKTLDWSLVIISKLKKEIILCVIHFTSPTVMCTPRQTSQC